MKTVTAARTGLSNAAMIGSMTISRVMKPGPPMNGVRGKNVVTTKVAANPAARVRSAVLGNEIRLVSFWNVLPPYSGVSTRRNGWEAPLTRLVAGSLDDFDLRLCRKTGKSSFKGREF